jgi:hypothetical protein
MQDPEERMIAALDVVCWCESRIAKIPTLDVRALRTWSCGIGCVPIRGFELAEPVGKASFYDGNRTRLAFDRRAA